MIAEGRRRHQTPCRDTAVLIARHIGARIGPTDAGAGRHGADADDHRAHRCRCGIEHSSPVDVRDEKPADHDVQGAKNVRRPFLDDQQGRVAETGNRQRHQHKNGDEQQRQTWRTLGFYRGGEKD
jgi:hypothetical protein